MRLLAWAIGLGLLFGLIGAGEYPEDRLRVVRNHINERPASGEIVLVAVDEKALREVGRWPWPRATYAELIDKIEAMRPRQQVHDWLFSERSDPKNDQALSEALARADNPTIGYLPRIGAQEGKFEDISALPEFSKHARLASIAMYYNYANEVWQLPLSVERGQQKLPTMATVLASKDAQPGNFRVNYSFAPQSVPSVSAVDILEGRVDPARIAGKTIVVAPASDRIGDQYHLPGWGRSSGVNIHILGAETLLAGRPVDLGWFAAFVLACVVAVASVKVSNRTRFLMLGAASAAALSVPILLEQRQIFADITPALFVMIWMSCGYAVAQVKKRGLVNAVSGLPNTNALRRSKDERDRTLVVARVVNFQQIVSTLSLADERSLVEQIVARLKVGSDVTTIYQGEEGVFAWTVAPGTAIGHHVEALHALFRSPAKVSGKSFDVAVTFGVEIGSGRSIANRLGSALVAADEATAEGLRWKYHDPERLKDAEWRLSLLSQLDDAIDQGQVWVAYQPQLDLATNRIRGAEALARWTHPTKGPISPVEFISAAEQSDRIEKLTMFVLDQAVAAAKQLNKEHGRFDVAVNLSARMLSDKSLPSKVKATLAKHGLEPERLTLELTETATLANAADIGSLFGLRDLGIGISIDDYGTGLSTLEYLKKVPASELKIDQSFVKSMRDHRSDLVMVQSTIALAHSLGRTVVAEGVETSEILDMLVAMKCEVAQGFIIGRPCSLNDLAKRLLAERKRRAA